MLTSFQLNLLTGTCCQLLKLAKSSQFRSETSSQQALNRLLDDAWRLRGDGIQHLHGTSIIRRVFTNNTPEIFDMLTGREGNRQNDAIGR